MRRSGPGGLVTPTNGRACRKIRWIIIPQRPPTKISRRRARHAVRDQDRSTQCASENVRVRRAEDDVRWQTPNRAQLQVLPPGDEQDRAHLRRSRRVSRRLLLAAEVRGTRLAPSVQADATRRLNRKTFDGRHTPRGRIRLTTAVASTSTIPQLDPKRAGVVYGRQSNRDGDPRSATWVASRTIGGESVLDVGTVRGRD